MIDLQVNYQIRYQFKFKMLQPEPSKFVSQFSISHKRTPSTAHQGSLHESSVRTCHYCTQHLSTITAMRKNEILLELQLEQLKEKVEHLQKQNQELVNSRVLTYHQYQSKLEESNGQYWNRQDIEAQLFEAKIIIELLLLSKTNHPQIKPYTEESIKQRYSEVLLDNLKLKQMVSVRDKMIQEKNMFPIYHYDKRIETLRKAVSFWYRKSQGECQRMRCRVKDMKARMEDDRNKLLEEVRKQFDRNKGQLLKVLDMANHIEKSVNHASIIQKKTKNIFPIPEKKKGGLQTLKANQIKKIR